MEVQLSLEKLVGRIPDQNKVGREKNGGYTFNG
jgi:hypothetical protein